MKHTEVVELYDKMLGAAPGEAMRLGVAGNTPQDISERWERQKALSDYHEVLRRQGLEPRQNRIVGLAAVGDAYGDVDRLKASGSLPIQLEEHLNFSRGQTDEAVLEQIVEDAIEDARNPERRARIPAKADADQWWPENQERYENPDAEGLVGRDMVAADDTVHLLRRRIVDALRHSQYLAENPRRRAEAEQYIKQQMRETDQYVEGAVRKYQSAAKEFRAARQRDVVSGTTEQVLEAHEESARQKAAALQRYSVVLAVAAKRTTPFMAGMRRSLGERFPHEEQAILDTKAGRLASAASVESALNLTPKDPTRWDPQQEGFEKKTQEYFTVSGARDGFDGTELKNARHRILMPSLRGQALAMACYDVMSDKQRAISNRWANVTTWKPDIDEVAGYNSAQAENYAKGIGIPPMPVTPQRVGIGSADDVVAQQDRMVSMAETEARMYAVAPPSPVPDVEVSAGMDR